MEPSEGYVSVLGFKLFYRSFGTSSKGTLLALHGGPGGTHDYLLPLADLVQFGYRVVLYDQLGCGKSEQPEDPKHYTERHAVDEAEGIRKALRLGRIHLFGNSYGGALALDVALRHSGSLSSLIVSSGYASAELTRREQPRLMSRMPKWVRDTTARYKATGDLKNPKYLEAVDAFDRKHYCRLRVWPYDWWYMAEHYRPELSHGRMKGWDVTDRLPEIKIPCLVTVGRYDVMTPKCSQAIHQGIRGSKLVLFEKSSHTAMWEERERYIDVVHSFLDEVRPR